VLVEIHREDIPTLPRLLALLRKTERRCLLFCDDLSFDQQDTSYKSLKAVLEGGIEGRPANVVLYATSNRRHLLSRDMIENERSTAINPGEAVEEKVSLSDRFGLWLGFHRCSQDEYLAMVDGYVSRYRIPFAGDELRREALEWATTRGALSDRFGLWLGFHACDQETYHAMVLGYAERFGLDLPSEQLRAEASEWAITRGARSGRVAWQYIQDLAGRLGKQIGNA
jgi:predicted AAA+ superfamily ATPase